MDYFAELKLLEEKFSELKSERVRINKLYVDSESNSPEEEEFKEQLQKIDIAIDNTKEDLEYYCKKWLKDINFDSFNNYVTFDNKSIQLDMNTLRSIIDDTGYKSQLNEGRIVIVFGAQEDLVSDLIFTFFIEDEFLKSVVYMIECDAKDDYLRRKIQDICNSYNEETRIMKAYIDNDGTLMLERQDILACRVTKDNISRIINYVFAASLHLYKTNKEIFATIKKNNG